MVNATFIVWREAVEAILVVGIRYAWLDAAALRRHGLRRLRGAICGPRPGPTVQAPRSP